MCSQRDDHVCGTNLDRRSSAMYDPLVFYRKTLFQKLSTAHGDAATDETTVNTT